MIYLKREQDEFTRTKNEFTEAYGTLVEQMARTFVEKGKARDVGSPFHHRQGPTSMLAIAKAKCHRVESALSRPAWQEDPELLGDIIEEATDAANYLVFIAALCLMFASEEEQECR